MFALIFLVAFFLIGFSIDFRRMQNAKSHLQVATDSSVLAAARAYMIDTTEKDTSKREAKAKTIATDYLNANLASYSQDMKNIGISLTFKSDGEIVGDSYGDLDLIFGGLFGKKTNGIPARSAAKVGDSRRLEIVLVLDNSTSMFREDRMVKLRKAAKNFSNIIFDNAVAGNTAQIGIVPWATTVNINVEAPKSWDANPGLDPSLTAAGSRSIPATPFEDREKYLYRPFTYTGNYPTAEMDDDYGPVDWRGCITAAQDERQVNASGSVVKALTDAPVANMQWPAMLIDPEIKEKWVNYDYVAKGGGSGSSYGSGVGDTSSLELDGPIFASFANEQALKEAQNNSALSSTISSFLTTEPLLHEIKKKDDDDDDDDSDGDGGSVNGCTNPYKGASGNCNINSYVQPRKSQCENGKSCNVFSCNQDDRQWYVSGLRNAWMPVNVPCSTSTYKIQTGQLSACVSDPNEFEYIADGGKACTWIPSSEFLPWQSTGQPVSGPNRNCPSAMLGMSQSRPQIFDKLNHIYPTPGGTQADVGLMWGLRILSPEKKWNDFFGYSTLGKPEAFGSYKARKMMILLSDGKNEAPYHYEGYYGCNEEKQSNDSHSGRLWTGDCVLSKGVGKLDDDSLNALMIDSCDAIRNYGIELYTIALDLDSTDSEENKAIKLLRDCAGQDDRAFNISNGQLDDTFKGLAARALRLSQ